MSDLPLIDHAQWQFDQALSAYLRSSECFTPQAVQEVEEREREFGSLHATRNEATPVGDSARALALAQRTLIKHIQKRSREFRRGLVWKNATEFVEVLERLTPLLNELAGERHIQKRITITHLETESAKLVEFAQKLRAGHATLNVDDALIEAVTSAAGTLAKERQVQEWKEPTGHFLFSVEKRSRSHVRVLDRRARI